MPCTHHFDGFHFQARKHNFEIHLVQSNEQNKLPKFNKICIYCTLSFKLITKKKRKKRKLNIKFVKYCKTASKISNYNNYNWKKKWKKGVAHFRIRMTRVLALPFETSHYRPRQINLTNHFSRIQEKKTKIKISRAYIEVQPSSKRNTRFDCFKWNLNHFLFPQFSNHFLFSIAVKHLMLIFFFQ